MSEQWYDEEVAPALLELSRRCQEKGVSFLAVVEYASGERGRTSVIAEDAGLEMRMLDFCARSGSNVDGYFINLTRYCRQHGIPTDSSIVMNRMSGTL